MSFNHIQSPTHSIYIFYYSIATIYFYYSTWTSSELQVDLVGLHLDFTLDSSRLQMKFRWSSGGLDGVHLEST